MRTFFKPIFLIVIVAIVGYGCKQNQSPRLSENIITRHKTNINEISLSDSTNTLNGKIQTLELDYIAWGCACANWITLKDYKKYQDTNLSSHCIFIEPANDSLTKADSILPGKNFIRVTGQFYTRKGYPKGTFKTEEELDSAYIFRYTKIKILTH